MIPRITTYQAHHDLETPAPDHLSDQEGVLEALLAHSDTGMTVIRRGIVELCLCLSYPSQSDFQSSLDFGVTIGND